MDNVIHVRILILGAGFGGLGMGAQLKRRGDNDFAIIEKSSDIGGVWLDNAYPGAACDTEAHLYCYSFFPHLRVSKKYADRNELLGYMRSMVSTYELESHLKLGTEIVSANWNPDRKIWEFEMRDGRRYTARFFVPAWGQLNRPTTPEFEGLDTFGGQRFHSAEWDASVDLKDKRVGSIGNAASAVQYIPEIAPEVGQLKVFQRSANWIMPRLQKVFTKELLDAYEANPELFEESRRELHEFREDGFKRTQMGTKEQSEGMRVALAHLKAQVEDADLRAKLTPDYDFGCKRILRTDDYYPALGRDNVDLETAGIARIVPEGIETTDGVVHELDVLIFGTGFSSQAFHGDLSITGLNGQSLSNSWKDGAEAYLGMTVPGFPNMFMIYGPNTNLNHNSIITMLEIQQNYIIDAISAVDSVSAAVDVKQEVFSTFNDKVQADMASSAFSSGCSSWYKNAAGKVVNNWSGTVDQYRSATQWAHADFNWS